ncbi:MAG: hypothetical protein NTZ80_02325 [Patescibacteria group bacterium]|nr:hypothetical protein [Patescibacteria group bacterium]
MTKNPLIAILTFALIVALAGCTATKPTSENNDSSKTTDPASSFETQPEKDITASQEDPALQTIKHYYELLGAKNLMAAYEITQKEVPFDTFNFWYQDLSAVSLKDIQKKADGTYSFISELTEGRIRTEYQVEMTADNEKILDSKSSKTKTINMDTWPSYKSDEYGFELKYPFGWRYSWDTPKGVGKGITVTFWPFDNAIYNEKNPAIFFTFSLNGGDEWSVAAKDDASILQALNDMKGLAVYF